MKRRNFITTSLAAAAAAGNLQAADILTTNRKFKNISYHEGMDSYMLAGLSLKELKGKYNYYLFEDFLPFMDKYIIDHKYGGFMCTADRDGTRISTDKHTWYEGRGIWVYSFLYRNFGKNPEHLEVARKSIDLMLKIQPEGNNHWPARISRKGEPITPPAVRIYGDVFFAEGLSQFALASGEWKYWDMAKDIILKCWKNYNDPGYYPDAVKDYGGPEYIPFPGAKIQGVAMVMVVTLTQMLRMKKDDQLEAIISECTNAVINKFFNPEFKLNNELLNHDYSRPDNYLSQFVYTGHSIETFWPLMSEAMRKDDVELFQTCAERLKRHIKVAWDNVYSGVFRCLNHVNEYIWVVDKVLWAQQESLNGIVMLIEQTGDKWAKKWFDIFYPYMVDEYYLKQYGYPLWITAADRKVTFEPHYKRIENYHLPRHLMFTLLSLNNIVENNGKPAWEAAVEKESK